MDIEAVKAIVTSSNTLVNWSMTIIGASLLALLSNSYIQPLNRRGKMIYLLYLPGWGFMAAAIYYGSMLERRGIMAVMEPVRIPAILEKMNDEYASQFFAFNVALLFFGVWLVLFLIWWFVQDTIKN